MLIRKLLYGIMSVAITKNNIPLLSQAVYLPEEASFCVVVDTLPLQ
jgi:hypothetical protein